MFVLDKEIRREHMYPAKSSESPFFEKKVLDSIVNNPKEVGKLSQC